MVPCMFTEYPGLHHELLDFSERCVACNQNAHRLCINEFSDIELNEVEAIYCSKLCKPGFPDLAMDMTAKSERTQSEENGRRFRACKRKEKRVGNENQAVSGRSRRRNPRCDAPKQFCTKYFPKELAKRLDWTRHNIGCPKTT